VQNWSLKAKWLFQQFNWNKETRLPDYHQHIGRECVCQPVGFQTSARLLPLSTRSALIIGFKLGNRTEWIKRVLVNETFSLTWFLIHDLSGYVVTANFNLGPTVFVNHTKACCVMNWVISQALPRNVTLPFVPIGYRKVYQLCLRKFVKIMVRHWTD